LPTFPLGTLGAFIELEAMLSQARKHKVSLVLTNQYLAQLSDDLKSAVFGNVGITVSYLVGKDDAEYLSKHFEEYPKRIFWNWNSCNLWHGFSIGAISMNVKSMRTSMTIENVGGQGRSSAIPVNVTG
jgi:hypothetical protein